LAKNFALHFAIFLSLKFTPMLSKLQRQLSLQEDRIIFGNARLLYEHQQALDHKHLETYTALLGLDLAQFIYDMSNHVYSGRVREDFLSGILSGLNGTPTFYINGIRYIGSWIWRVSWRHSHRLSRKAYDSITACIPYLSEFKTKNL